MKKPRELKDYFLLFIKGTAMGAANKVPGVSGGVVAFVTGFYEEFIFTLQRLNKRSFLLLKNLRFKLFLQYINFSFLGVLLLGTTFSYFSVSKLLDYLIRNYEILVWSLFFGLIIGSVFYVAKDFEVRKKANLFLIAIGLIFGIGISFLTPAQENDHLLFVFFCGIISVSGMTLPGLSGSFLLILLGNYVLLLVDSVNALYDTATEVVSGNFQFVRNQERVRLLQVLASFTAGSVVGLVSLSHLLGFLLKRYKDKIFALITGFIAGSLGMVWPWKSAIYKVNENGTLVYDDNHQPILENYERFLPSLWDLHTLFAFFCIILGVLIVLSLGWYGKQDKK
ncbi:MAG: DUF368 domain-containing protein [Flavobacteriaceae bacterium]|nr:DUF368 domain-containing protein [Flavobacteriaceae bacterium]